MLKIFRRYLSSLLPAYVNGTLSPFLEWVVRKWLEQDKPARLELETIQRLQKAAREQTLTVPPVEVFQRVRARIKVQEPVASPARIRPVWIGAMGLVILSLIIFWNVLPPGIVLQFSTQGGQPATFRIYRAQLDSTGEANYELLEEISPSASSPIYTYKDYRLFPGQKYLYRVEVINQEGFLSASPAIAGNSAEALPGQIAVLATLLIGVYGVYTLRSTVAYSRAGVIGFL